MALAPSVYARNVRNDSGCIVASRENNGPEPASASVAVARCAAAGPAAPRRSASRVARSSTTSRAKVASYDWSTRMKRYSSWTT